MPWLERLRFGLQALFGLQDLAALASSRFRFLGNDMVNGTLASAPDVKDVFKGYPAPGVGAGAGTTEVSVLVALGSIRHRHASPRGGGCEPDQAPCVPAGSSLRLGRCHPPRT